ncbi:hypothetical protein JMUB7549_27670 [Staphylococcus aureus]
MLINILSDIEHLKRIVVQNTKVFLMIANITNGLLVSMQRERKNI